MYYVIKSFMTVEYYHFIHASSHVIVCTTETGNFHSSGKIKNQKYFHDRISVIDFIFRLSIRISFVVFYRSPSPSPFELKWRWTVLPDTIMTFTLGFYEFFQTLQFHFSFFFSNVIVDCPEINLFPHIIIPSSFKLFLAGLYGQYFFIISHVSSIIFTTEINLYK